MTTKQTLVRLLGALMVVALVACGTLVVVTVAALYEWLSKT